MGCKGNFDGPTGPCSPPKDNLKRQLNHLIKAGWIDPSEKKFVLAARELGYDVYISLGMPDDPYKHNKGIEKLKIEIIKSKYK